MNLVYSAQTDVAVSQHCVYMVHTCSYVPALMRPYSSVGSTARIQIQISGAFTVLPVRAACVGIIFICSYELVAVEGRDKYTLLSVISRIKLNLTVVLADI